MNTILCRTPFHLWVDMSPRKRILMSGDEMSKNHRGDFETCPHCGHNQKSHKWNKLAHTLTLQPRAYRKGCASISAECPRCFETSWVHIRLDSVDSPETWQKAAEFESSTQKLAALREWGAALCWQCVKLESGTVNHGTYRVCSIGMGPTTKTCDHFQGE